MSWFTKHFVDPIVAPLKVFAAMDPVGQAISGDKVSFNPDKNLNAGLHTMYQNDPIAQDVGIKESDAVKAGKVAAVVAATYFTAGAASGLVAADAGAATSTATVAADTGAGWVSAEGATAYAGGTAADAATAATVADTSAGWVSAEGGTGYAGGAAADAPSSFSAAGLFKNAQSAIGYANTATNLINKFRNQQKMPNASSPFRSTTYGDPNAMNQNQEMAKQTVAPNSPLTKSLPPTIAGMPTKTVIAVAVLAGALYLAYKYGGKDIAKVVS